MDIKVLKLITGEEIMGEVIQGNPMTITMNNVVAISVVRGKDGQPNVGFSPFPIYAEPESNVHREFKREHIVYEYEPAEDFKSNYDQIFGTGLITPPKKLIVG